MHHTQLCESANCELVKLNCKALQQLHCCFSFSSLAILCTCISALHQCWRVLSSFQYCELFVYREGNNFLCYLSCIAHYQSTTGWTIFKATRTKSKSSMPLLPRKVNNPYTFVQVSCFLWGLSTWCSVPCRGSLQETREIYMQDYWPSMEALCLLPNHHPLSPLIIFLSSSLIFLSDFLLIDFLISAVTIYESHLIPRRGRASQFWPMRHEQYDTHM